MVLLNPAALTPPAICQRADSTDLSPAFTQHPGITKGPQGILLLARTLFTTLKPYSVLARLSIAVNVFGCSIPRSRTLSLEHLLLELAGSGISPCSFSVPARLIIAGNVSGCSLP
jgi:hypothetical protein